MGADKSQEENSSTHQRTISLRNCQPAAYSMPPQHTPFQKEPEIIPDSETEAESELESHPDNAFDYIENQLGLPDHHRSSLPPVDADINPVDANINPIDADISANKGNDSEVMNTDIVLRLGDNVRTTLLMSLWC